MYIGPTMFEVAADKANASTFSDTELISTIRALRIIVKYFRDRGDSALIVRGLFLELQSLENMGLARGWNLNKVIKE